VVKLAVKFKVAVGAAKSAARTSWSLTNRETCCPGQTFGLHVTVNAILPAGAVCGAIVIVGAIETES
jgi:hypothetical protein